MRSLLDDADARELVDLLVEALQEGIFFVVVVGKRGREREVGGEEDERRSRSRSRSIFPSRIL